MNNTNSSVCLKQCDVTKLISQVIEFTKKSFKNMQVADLSTARGENITYLYARSENVDI